MPLFIARRPVFDSREKIFAYDLALRSSTETTGSDHDGHPEQLLAELFLETGADRIAEGHNVIVTVNRDLLVDRSLPQLPIERVFLHIPPTVKADAEVDAACRDLQSSGYRLVVHGDDPLQSRALLESAQVIKIDVGKDSARLPALTNRFRTYPARLLAMNVRHREERDRCMKLGFDLFEGYRFSAPEHPRRRDMGIEHLNVFRVLKLVRDPDATDQQIEDLLRRDVGLSYKLLRMVNTAATGAREIWSIGHALRLLGRMQVGRWLCVLLVTDERGAGVRGELVQLSLLHARFCELLADVTGVRQARDPLFLVGMLSVLDQLLEVPMTDLCDAMELAPDIRKALLHRADFFGAVLRLVESYVSGAWSDVENASASLGIVPSSLQPLYLESLGWATSQRNV